MVARDHRQIQAMIRLIDDMLDVSRMHSGLLSIRPAATELAGLLRRLTDDLARQAGDAGTSITLHASQAVSGWWDEFRIEQVIVNLLTNAIRYGDGKPVEVRMNADSREVRVEVIDQGAGIPEDMLPRIFEPYERGSSNAAPAGLGLGLYISRQLAEAHSGTLTVRSKPGEGSSIMLTLPRTEAPAP
jgi:signal transduction histidine kinase